MSKGLQRRGDIKGDRAKVAEILMPDAKTCLTPDKPKPLPASMRNSSQRATKKCSKLGDYSKPTFSSMQKLSQSKAHMYEVCHPTTPNAQLTHKGNSSTTPSQSKTKCNKEVFNVEVPKAKRVKDEKDDKKRIDKVAKVTKDRKKDEKDVKASGKDEQQENTTERTEHLEKLEKAKSDQEALDEELKKCQERCKKLEAQLAKANDELSVKSKEAEAYQAKIDNLKKELEQCHLSLSKVEERNFKFTNAFTSAGEGSVLDISNRYRHLQHNNRPAAVRAMKKISKIDFKEHICNQVMRAYETAKAITLREVGSLIEKLLFELQPVTQDPVVVHDKELLQTCMILLGYLQKDETKNTAAITEIKETLMKKSATLLHRESLPSEVENYYQSLSELMWCAVARPIPMITAKSPDTYCKCYHELNNDDDDIEDDRAISYVYPVLYTSNKSPRELAQKGKVVVRMQS